MPIINNHEGAGPAVIRATSSETHTMADFQKANETVTDITIRRVFFSGNVTIAFGSNTQLTLSGTDHWMLDQSNAGLQANGASIVLTLGTGSTAVVVVGKTSTLNANAAANVNYAINP